ncbi:IS1380 family transposase, partial [Agrilactobacillus composti]
RIKATLKFKELKIYRKYPEASLLNQLIYQIIAGYDNDKDADHLRYDPIFRTILPDGVASQPTISRFLKRLSDFDSLKSLHDLMSSFITDFFESAPEITRILDIDSTHSDTYGKQGGAFYNGHYGTNGYHPFVAFLADSGLLIDAELRPGNVYTSDGADVFLKEILERHPDQKFVIRADSGFATPKIYDLLEEKQTNYVIRLKSNSHLQRIAQRLFEDDQTVDFTSVTGTYFYRTAYQAASWESPRQVIIFADRNGKLIPDFQFFITTLTSLSDKDIVKTYRSRGIAENYIKEIKNGFYFNKTDSSDFFTNEVRMVLSGIAYNLVKLLQHEIFPKSEKKTTIDTIRIKFIKIGASFARHSRKLWIHLTKSNPYDSQFWWLLDKIQSSP